jgi:hypothetical protein
MNYPKTHHGRESRMQTIVPSQTKIRKLDCLIFVDENILRLQIAVNDIISV